ncbi:MAG: metalloregulator ArsR/SmtB family transcription factor [Thermoplasmata archaeon]|nr:metalloregulator ArsR/SmtB family transcription factor [Thermoplasmata archaeon]
MYQRKITLDQESFKALASDTRIEILKRLDKSQMTVTDLANELQVNKSAVYKHLSRLLDAGLVKKLEDNRKWVYYKLSMKGMHLLHPERVQIALMLSASVLAITLALSQIYMFVVGNPVTTEVSRNGDTFIETTFVTEMIHDPLLLAIGCLLIAVGSVLAYMAYRVYQTSETPDYI